MKDCDKCWGTGKVIDHRDIGRKIRKERIHLGLSLKAASHYMGITPSFLCYLESGKRCWTKKLYIKAIDCIR